MEEGLLLIKQLATCEKGGRDRAISKLIDSWLPSQSEVSEDLMRKLWKGLFYCYWHSDKFPAQSELADKLSSAMADKLDLSVSIPFLSVFFLTMRREWSGIDVLRLDKFYLLIRRFVNGMFVLLRNNSWDLDLSRRLVRVLEDRVFLADDKFQGNGVNYHVASVFVEEISGFLPIGAEVLEAFFGAFVSMMGKVPDKVLLGKVKGNVFDVLIEKARVFLEAKKSGEVAELDCDVESIGSIALSMGFSSRFYELGSSPDCIQGHRRVIFGLHEEFLKLEKDFASSGFDVPKLISISEPSEEEAVALKKCRGKGKASNGVVGDETKNENQKKKKKKKKDKKKQKDETETETEKVVEDSEIADVIPLGESAISNLQLQFEKIAAESGLDEANYGEEIPSSCDSPKKPTVSKKRKRSTKSANKKQSQPRPVEEEANGGESAVKSAKKVKFSMKNNIIWKPQSPLPPHSLRLPPSATPRGSALKKGVPAGPVREITAPPKRTAKLRAVPVKKARKAVKRLKKKPVSP